MSTIIEKNSLLQRNDKAFLAADLDNEMILMDVDSYEYSGMDKTTTEIWKFLDTPKSMTALIIHLTSIYEVSAEQCEKDVRPVLENMVERNFLSLTEKNNQ